MKEIVRSQRSSEKPGLWNGQVPLSCVASRPMQAGAHTPEELETLFEDACVTRHRDAVAALFEDGAVLVAGATPKQAARAPGDLAGHRRDVEP